ncbi:MAG: fumarylacetoacetate hydrolase family protein [Pseudomonadota bacterium]
MLTSDVIRAIAQQMKAAQDESRQLPPFSAQIEGFDLASAYAVADLIHRARVQQGAVPVGRKIGFTNPHMWDRYGVREPIWAYVYDSTVVHTDGKLRPCSLGRFTEPKIEPEIVFHFHQTPPPGAEPSALLGCIDWVAHGLEIVQSHFPGWKFEAADTVADWALHATLLVGEPQPLERLGTGVVDDLQHFTVDLSCNGVLRERGVGANVLDSPLLALAHLISVLARQPQYPPLQAGELVTTGTITSAHPVQAGEVWRTDLHGIALPGMAVEFVGGCEPCLWPAGG